MGLHVEQRLCDEDAKLYAFGEDWYTFDEAALVSMDSDELIMLETAMDYTIGELVYGLGRKSTQAMKAALWISRKLQHPDIEKFKDFKPKVWLAQSRLVDDDGNEVEVGADGEVTPVAAEADADPLDGGPQETSG